MVTECLFLFIITISYNIGLMLEMGMLNVLPIFSHFLFCEAEQLLAAYQNCTPCFYSLLWMNVGIWPLCSSYLYSCETDNHGWTRSCLYSWLAKNEYIQGNMT